MTWELALFLFGAYLILVWYWWMNGRNVHLLRLDMDGISTKWDGPFKDDGHGFRFVISFGEWLRPVTGIKWARWHGIPVPQMDGNPWTDPGAKVRRSFIPLPGVFISYEHRNGWGFYVGWKAFDVDQRDAWADAKDYGRSMLCPSLSIRRSANR